MGGSFKLDVNDARIAKVFSSVDFEIDPTNPRFRQSEGMQEVLRKKRHQKRGSLDRVKATTEESALETATDATAVHSSNGQDNSRKAASSRCLAPHELQPSWS